VTTSATNSDSESDDQPDAADDQALGDTDTLGENQRGQAPLFSCVFLQTQEKEA
jgi:hypothetical protein